MTLIEPLHGALQRCVDNADALIGLPDFPYATKDGRWQTVGASDAGFMPAHGSWTVGFAPGLLWLAYRITGDQRYVDAALERCARFTHRKGDGTTHDIGFVFTPSFIQGYRLTGEKWLREAALEAAITLAARYNREGKFLRAWGPLNSTERAGETTIDAMMNLELLYWAAEESSSRELATMATSHAETSARFLVRPDGSTFHAYAFDPMTGTPLRGFTHQGLSDDSVWSRGQAWAIYGFARAAQWTGSHDFTAVSGRCADLFLRRLAERPVPPWDFDSAAQDPLDSSAGAITAAGLLTLSSIHADRDAARHYQAAATDLLVGLTEHCSTALHEGHEGLLTSGTWHLAADFAVGEALIYGDYYYMEALQRLQELQESTYGAQP
ncbi:glycoside hydrolase family 88 protein [Pedococcus sp. 5OH_020]|uniref:glycoside hydrolase family 88 protein n=1 Tax=Pedococcus sp. 5OH_020 TaxID=2989814 RepID=UPI0022E99C2D|nr:glycoside hydrolase family 88 protein [Pedococcus sp. 5OH_020]